MDSTIYTAGSVLSTDPLITISKRGDDLIAMGVAGLLRDYCRGHKALHILGLCRTVEAEGQIEDLVTAISEISNDLKGNHFLVLANTEYEAFLLGEAGVPALFASELIFIDERKFAPQTIPSDDGNRYDAVYNARFDSRKRHELASMVDHLVLIYSQYEADAEERYREMKGRMPDAHFANHDAGGGAYQWLSHDEVCTLVNRSRVGLCLSIEDGAMRASMEYLLCGLPVVTTPNSGGRDRYLNGPYCATVDATAEAVADGVQRLIESDFDRMQIRNHAGQLLTFDRYNFLLNLNKVVKSVFGVADMFPSFEPFVGHPIYWRPAEEVLAPLTPLLQGV